MNCPRCQGLMVGDEYVDLQDDTGQNSFVAWRCLICGEVLDPVILKHRTAAPVLISSRARVRLVQALDVPRRKTRQSELWGEPNEEELCRVALPGVEVNSADEEAPAL